MIKKLFKEVIELPDIFCVDFNTPTKNKNFFLGNNIPNTNIEIDLTFSFSTEEQKIAFENFYEDVQNERDGFFFASVPIFKAKETYLFRFNNKIDLDFSSKYFTNTCIVYSEWEEVV